MIETRVGEFETIEEALQELRYGYERAVGRCEACQRILEDIASSNVITIEECIKLIKTRDQIEDCCNQEILKETRKLMRKYNIEGMIDE